MKSCLFFKVCSFIDVEKSRCFERGNYMLETAESNSERDLRQGRNENAWNISINITCTGFQGKVSCLKKILFDIMIWDYSEKFREIQRNSEK